MTDFFIDLLADIVEVFADLWVSRILKRRRAKPCTRL